MGCAPHQGASGVDKGFAHSADDSVGDGAGSDVGGASCHLGRDMRVGGVTQAQHHLGQPHAISHRVVEAAHERRARGAVVKCDLLDQCDVPQRAVAIEWSRALLGDVALQLGHAGRLGQSHPSHMPVEMEFRVDLPHPSALAEEGARPEDREAVDDACGRRSEQRIPVRLGVEEHHAVDDHEVVGPVHGEPQRVLRAHGPLLVRHGSPPGVARRVGRAAPVGLGRTTVRRLPPTGPVTGWRHDRAGVHPHGCSYAHGRLRRGGELSGWSGSHRVRRPACLVDRGAGCLLVARVGSLRGCGLARSGGGGTRHAARGPLLPWRDAQHRRHLPASRARTRRRGPAHRRTDR